MKSNIIQIVIIAAIITIPGCKIDDVDIQPPSMDVLEFNPQPIEDEICGSQDPTVFNLMGGDQLTFDVVFTDNETLSQYKIDIHNNFDCHGHGGGSAPSVVVPNVENQTVDWSILDIQSILGSSVTVKRVLTVPENVTAGNYHFQIQVVDESGNDNPAANFFSLKLKNPLDDIVPQIEVNLPQSTTLTANRGEAIRFSGRVNDNYSLSEGGNGVLFLAYTNLSSGNTFTTDEFFVFDENVDKSFDFDFEYVIPSSLTTGNYRLSLGANDGVRNVADFKFFDLEVRD